MTRFNEMCSLNDKYKYVNYCEIIINVNYCQHLTRAQPTKVLQIGTKRSQLNAILLLQLRYRRETALQGGLVLAKSGRLWNWETIFYGHYYRSIFNHCDIIGLQSYRIR